MQKITPQRKVIFVNLAVKSLNRAVKFFTKVGFMFDKEFTNENGATLIIGKDSKVVLLDEKFFKALIPGKRLIDARKNAETLLGISASSRKEVDDVIEKVIKAGGSEYRQVQENGRMYGRAFQDLDGHVWGVLYITPQKK